MCEISTRTASRQAGEEQKKLESSRWGRLWRSSRFCWPFRSHVYACGLDDTVIGSTTENPDAGVGADGAIAGDGSTARDGAAVDGSGTDGSAGPAVLVVAASGTDLYALDVDSSMLTKLGALSGCNDFLLDIAIDPSGNLFAVTQNGGDRDIGPLSMAGVCGTSVHGDSTHMLSIGYFGTAPATLFELRDDDNLLDSLDPTTGNDDTINNSALPGDALTDIACSSTLCYVMVDHSHCTPDPGGGGSCLWSIQPDGTGGAQVGPLSMSGLGGLAYHGSNVFLFSSTSATVSKISTTIPPAVTALALHGDPPPASWLGAASSSAYP